ncbi:MAG: hypothetical protein PF481_03685 [Bacteroidales bacterium]|jgi:hypothetical protein|nr:hypothetical protein [Bacteroidales bacterium]
MEDQLQAAFFTGYYNLKPYNETVINYSNVSDISVDYYDNYRAIPFGIVTDFKLVSILDDKLSPVLGADYYFERVKHSDYNIENESYLDSEHYWVWGITFKAEIMYEINDQMAASIGLAHSYKVSTEYYIPAALANQKLWDTYIKYKYYLN